MRLRKVQNDQAKSAIGELAQSQMHKRGACSIHAQHAADGPIFILNPRRWDKRLAVLIRTYGLINRCPDSCVVGAADPHARHEVAYLRLRKGALVENRPARVVRGGIGDGVRPRRRGHQPTNGHGQKQHDLSHAVTLADEADHAV